MSVIQTSLEVPLLVAFIVPGVGCAKNGAVALSRGRFLCFHDADDVSFPARLRLQLEAAVREEMRQENGSFPDIHRGFCLGFVFVGSGFVREPAESTSRYTRWANSLDEQQLYTQVWNTHPLTNLMSGLHLARTNADRADVVHLASSLRRCRRLRAERENWLPRRPAFLLRCLGQGRTAVKGFLAFY